MDESIAAKRQLEGGKQDNRRTQMDPDLIATVERAQQGDQLAYSQLFEQTQDRLFRFCMFLCADPQRAQDLCQDTFVKALGQLNSLRNPKRFLSWLFQCAKNQFIDFTRRSKNQPWVPIESVEPNLLDESSDPAEVDKIRQALSSLNEDARFVLLLVKLEGYTPVEAAEIIGITEAACRTRLRRARAAFLKKYEKR